MSAPSPTKLGTLERLPPRWRRRLREVWRSAGWPWQDELEAELLAAGLLERRGDAAGRETLRLSDAGVQALAASVQASRRALDAHEALVARVALEMHRAGRIVWRGLSLRAPLVREPARCDTPLGGLAGALGLPGFDARPPAPAPAARWVLARPDVYSIRHAMREDAVEPVVHEIKVTRADLLSDLRNEDKRAAYLALSSQCWYVMPEGVADPAEIPPEFGLLFARAPGDAAPAQCATALAAPLRLARAAPRRAHRIRIGTWVALARANRDSDPGGDDLAGAQPLR
jgi:hypothetical protein